MPRRWLFLGRSALDKAGNDEADNAADFGTLWKLTQRVILLGYVTFCTCSGQVCVDPLLPSLGWL